MVMLGESQYVEYMQVCPYYFHVIHVSAYIHIQYSVNNASNFPKDAKFLNRPIVNYVPMQIIFGNSVATMLFTIGFHKSTRTAV